MKKNLKKKAHNIRFKLGVYKKQKTSAENEKKQIEAEVLLLKLLYEKSESPEKRNRINMIILNDGYECNRLSDKIKRLSDKIKKLSYRLECLENTILNDHCGYKGFCLLGAFFVNCCFNIFTFLLYYLVAFIFYEKIFKNLQNNFVGCIISFIY